MNIPFFFSSAFRVKPVGPSNMLSMAQLRTLPLGDQVKTLMKNGTFSKYTNSAHQYCLCSRI